MFQGAGARCQLAEPTSGRRLSGSSLRAKSLGRGIGVLPAGLDPPGTPVRTTCRVAVPESQSRPQGQRAAAGEALRLEGPAEGARMRGRGPLGKVEAAGCNAKGFPGQPWSAMRVPARAFYPGGLGLESLGWRDTPPATFHDFGLLSDRTGQAPARRRTVPISRETLILIFKK